MKNLNTFIFTLFVVTGLTLAINAEANNQVLLGEKQVRDLTERDTIQVGTSRGSFTGLRFKATGSAIEFKRIVIHFENGSEQVIEKNRVLGKGDKSRVINLEGGSRFIDKVVFYYEARSKGWKGAELKLFGVR